MTNGRCFSLAIALTALVIGALSPEVHAETGEVQKFDIRPQPLDSALLEFSEQADLQLVVAANLLTGIQTPGFTGESTAERVLVTLLDETSLGFRMVGATITVINGGKNGHQEDEDDSSEQDSADDPEDSGSVSSAGVSPGASNGKQPQEESEEGPLELETQTVTGSRLARTSLQTPAQVIVISRQDLENTGAPTLEQALRQLPQNVNGTTEFGGPRLYGVPDSSGRLLGTSNINGSSTINLRGLGESATLVLIDGKRVGDSGLLGGFTDISEFPLSIVERVEIQLDGASSIYGSDAIGGVINIILKRDYDLLKATLRRTARTRGGLAEHNASIAGGTAWDSGRVLLSIDAYQASNQDVGQTDLNLLGILQYGYPGNVRGRRGSLSSPREVSRSLTQAARDAGLISPEERVTRVTIPVGQDGTSLTLDDFFDSIGAYRTNEGVSEQITVSPESDRITFRLAANQKIADWLAVDGGVSYSTRKTYSNSGAAGGDITFDVAAENPYNPFGADVEVDLIVDGFGTRVITGERDSLTLDLDFDGSIADNLRWKIRSRFADRKSMSETLNYISHDGLNDLVDDTRVDPSSALNVFGNSFHTDANNADVLSGGSFHIPVQQSETTNTLASSELIVEGELFSLPAGKVLAVAGMEWRKVSVDVEYGNTFTRVITATAPTPGRAILDGFALNGTRTLRAGFAEFMFPIFSQKNSLPGIRDVNLVLSGRHESANGSSSEGIETNTRYQSNVWSSGLVYRPFEAVKLRVNKSTSFRAPEVAYALFPPLVSPGFIFDLRGGGFVPTRIETTSGGNPELGPEESTSLTWGVEITPSWLEGFAMSIDYHETLFRNRIAGLNLFGSLFVTDGLFDQFGFQYTLDADGRVTAFDSRPTNIAWIETQGSDYRMSYEFEMGGNRIGFTASMGITNSYLQELNTYDSEDPREHVGLFLPKRAYRAGAYWNRGGWRLAVNLRSKSSLRYETSQRLGLNPGETSLERIQVKIEPATTVDLRGTLHISDAWQSAPGILENVTLAFGLNNVFGSFSKRIFDPEPYDGLRGIPRGTSDARGRMYYLELSKEF